MNNSNPRWHVLCVKPKHEKKINIKLKEQNFDSFVPTVKTIRKWSDRKKKIYKPLFPSYVFLRISQGKEFYQPLKINGVFKYLRFGENYALVRDEEIKRIKLFLNLEGVSEVETSYSIPAIGEKMLVTSGPLCGLNCEVLKVKNKNKIYIQIESLRQNITAVVHPSLLHPRRQKGINQYAKKIY